MAITNGYTTLTDFKKRIEIDDSLDDGKLETVITAASRFIDNLASRRFYAATDTRYYTAELADFLQIDDLLSVTTLKTDNDGDRTYENTWATTDYDLRPFNATLDGWPYRWIETTPNGDYRFPTIAKGVELKGSFGFASTTPAPIEEACILVANRIIKRADTPLGVSAEFALGQQAVIVKELRADPDIMALIMPYANRW